MSDGPGFAGLLDNLHIDGPTKARITPFEADSVLSKPWIYPFASLVVVRKAVAFTYQRFMTFSLTKGESNI
ncbi:MAG: hypothetical protein ACM3X1_09660 [Ignavibacteriales bacterium]